MPSSKLFRDNLYFQEFVRTEGDKILAEIKLDQNHSLFQGHFPGNPVLPGVCMVQIIKEILSEALSRELQVKEAGNIKYLSFVNPGVNPVLQFEIAVKSSVGDEISCNARVFYKQTNFCSFKGVFRVVG